MSIADLREEVKKEKMIFGATSVMKLLNTKKTKKVYVTSNCPQKERILNLGKINGIEVVTLTETSKQIGMVCKKPFEVSALGLI